MASIESLIIGSEKITSVFGYWPSFHDAEILEMHFWRGNVQPEKSIYEFSVLTLTMHHWELTKEVAPEGYIVLRYHTLTRLRFYDMHHFQMQGFNHQNPIMGLSVRNEQRTKPPSPYFIVETEPSFGVKFSFECLRIEVLDALPCSEDGQAISNNP